MFIVKAGTGGAMFRSLHADFLRDMAELLDDADLRALAGTYDALASAWQMLATRAEGADHAGGAQAVEQIRSLEHLGVSLMQAWIEKHG